MLYRALLLALATAHAWNECAFPDVDYFVTDEGIGTSFAYGAAAMNGKLYTGGYMQGHLALVGVTDSGDVSPEPSATMWGDVQSPIQALYVAETDATGKMTKSWSMPGSGLACTLTGSHACGSRQPNKVQVNGVLAMLDKAHLAVKGEFSDGQLTMPDGTVLSSPKFSDGTNRNFAINQGSDVDARIQLVIKLDISKPAGIGAGTTGWARMLDEDKAGNVLHPGGTSLDYDVNIHGDKDGNMIVAYTGYTGYNASASTKREGGVHYVIKLSAADGTEMWRIQTPVLVWHVHPIDDGSFFVSYDMKSSHGAKDFGNGQIVPAAAAEMGARDKKSVVIKYSGAGVAQWTAVTHATGSGGGGSSRMSVSADGTLLAIIGASGGKPLLSRIDTSNGAVLWTANNNDLSTGGHGGYRGVEVTGTGSSAEIVVHGSITGSPVILHDSADSQITLRTRGSYDVYVAAFDAADGTGKWAMDGGGGGLDYFFAFSSDPDTHDIYVGGAVYNTPEYFQWGDVKRKNAHRQYAPSSEISGYVSTQKAFVAKLKSTTSLPTCLTTCSATFGKPQASDVKAGHCYINRLCYKEGEFSPYTDHGCMKCDPAMAPMAWSGPYVGDGTAFCHIGDKCIAEGTHEPVGYSCNTRYGPGTCYKPDPCSKCIPSVSGTAYSPVAEKGCMLNMATFAAACYDDKGAVTMNETAKLQLMADKTSMTTTVASMTTTVATMTTTMATRDATISTLQVDKAALQADKTTMTATVVARDATIVELRTAKEAAEQDGAAKTATIEAKDVLIVDQQEALSEESEDKMPTWAIAIIVVIGAVLLLVIAILGVVVSREQQGKPVFVPKKSAVTVTSGSSKI